MHLDSKPLINKIVALAAHCELPPVALALVGSSSPLSRDVVGRHSDIDLVILEDANCDATFLKELQYNIDRDWQVVATWDIVSSGSVGAPVIHLHITKVDNYLSYSSLFRRSVSKYPSIVGSSLSVYAPSVPLSRYELLYDQRGIGALLGRVTSSFSRLGCCSNETHNYASPIDISLYCVLHSVRNTLRWLRTYREFSSADELVGMWREIRAPSANSLELFLNWKRGRREGKVFSKDEEKFSMIVSRDFLSVLFNWVLQTPEPSDILRAECII
jgi:hypothetical protein